MTSQLVSSIQLYDNIIGLSIPSEDSEWGPVNEDQYKEYMVKIYMYL